MSHPADLGLVTGRVVPSAGDGVLESVPRAPKRSLDRLLDPLQPLLAGSRHLVGNRGARLDPASPHSVLPRYLFVGPEGGGERIRIGLFAVLHGDEPEGAHALVRFLELLEQHPGLAAGYGLYVYPVCNPTGYVDGTRETRDGVDLGGAFWRGSSAPEIRLLEQELATHAFHGLISLHSDRASEGVYGHVAGAMLTQHLLEPALEAAAQYLPRNRSGLIDGVPARNGIIRRKREGVLSVPPGVRPRPFQIVLETPQAAPQFLQEQAMVVALGTILAEHRRFIAYAADL